MWQQLFDLQREIYGQVSAHIRLFAESGGWLTLLAMLLITGMRGRRSGSSPVSFPVH